MTEEMQMSDLVLDLAAVEATVQDPMQWKEALLTATTGVVLPTVDVITDWMFVGKLLDYTIVMNVSCDVSCHGSDFNCMCLPFSTRGAMTLTTCTDMSQMKV